MNCGDCILLRAALRNRRSRLLFANYIRAFRAFSHSKNLTAVYAYRKAQETKFYGKLRLNLSSFFGDVFSQDKENERRRTSVLQAKFDAVFGKLSPNLSSFFGDVFSQDKASKPPLYMHTARRKKRSIAEKQPEKSDFHNVGFLFLCHIVNFFNVFVGYLLNFVLTVVELVFGYSFIFVELF